MRPIERSSRRVSQLPLLVVWLVTLAGAPAALRAQSVPPPPDSLPQAHLPAIIVTATRSPAAAAAVASAVTVITRDEIERRQYRTVLDALRAVPGVAIAQAGWPGGATGVFLRGAAGDQTLVLLDGVQLNDPSAPVAAYDLGTLPIDAVERIEIVRGPQGALYGAHAMGGVIHILTRTGGEGPPRVGLTLEGGTFATAQGSAAVKEGGRALQYALTASRRQTDGISVADGPVATAAPERDAHDVTAVTARLAWRASERLAVRGSLHASSADTEIDAEGRVGDDPNAAVHAGERAGRVELEW
ncbi:MAG: TonB-dependent receptor, partial [Gemmatimonadota bacterium]